MGWIKVTKRMPKDGQQVWVHYKGGEQGFAIWTESDQDWFIDVLETGDMITRQKAIREGARVAEITHWHPLPESPFEERLRSLPQRLRSAWKHSKLAHCLYILFKT